MQKVTEEMKTHTWNVEKQLRYFGFEDNSLGPIYHLVHPLSKQKFFMKQQVFADKEAFYATLLKSCARQKISHPNIANYIDYSAYRWQDGKTKRYYFRRFFKNAGETMEYGMFKRYRNGDTISTEEITLLFYDIIGACSYLQSVNCVHGNLSPGVIFHDKIENKFNLVDKLKYNSSFPQCMIDRFLTKDRLYFSPEFYAAVVQQNSQMVDLVNDFKSEVFVLGLTFLSIALNQHVDDVFSRSKEFFDQARLAHYMTQFKLKFASNPFVQKVLSCMLELDSSLRPDMIELAHLLPEKNILLNYLNKEKQILIAKKNTLKPHGVQKRPESRSQGQSSHHSKNFVLAEPVNQDIQQRFSTNQNHPLAPQKQENLFTNQNQIKRNKSYSGMLQMGVQQGIPSKQTQPVDQQHGHKWALQKGNVVRDNSQNRPVSPQQTLPHIRPSQVNLPPKKRQLF